MGNLTTALDAKITYLNYVKQALAKPALAHVYAALDAKRYAASGRELPFAISDTDAAMLSDQQAALADELTPAVLAFVAEYLPFVVPEVADDGEVVLYLGDWWDHRALGVLAVLRGDVTLDETVMTSLAQTATLPKEKSVFDAQIEALQTTNTALHQFIADSNKRQLALSVAEDQLATVDADKVSPFARRDVKEKWRAARQLITDKIDNLQAEEAKIPDVKEEIVANDAAILAHQKAATQIRLELAAITTVFGDFSKFEAALADFYPALLTYLEAHHDGL